MNEPKVPSFTEAQLDKIEAALLAWGNHIDAHAAFRALRRERVPRTPPIGLLMSMAVRMDHALACPGYYDQPMQQVGAGGQSHAQMLEAAMRQMRQIYEEVSGYGFYRPERDDEYVALHDATQASEGGEPITRADIDGTNALLKHARKLTEPDND